jgi:hypothetical protein
LISNKFGFLRAMKNNKIFTVEGVRGSPFSYEGTVLDIGAELTWTEAPSAFEKIEIDFGIGPVIFNADWKNCSDRIINSISIDKKIYKARNTSEEEFNRVVNELRNQEDDKEDVEIKVEFSAKAHCPDILESYLTFVFMALNIAAPGCADFYNVKISPAGKYYSDLRFSSHRFNHGWYKCLELGWPTIEKIDLSAVIKWLCDNEIFRGQVSRGGIQRIVYALLNVCSGKWLDPMEVIWLSHALENIVDSPSSNISKLLKDRLFLLTGKPKNNIKKYKRLIDSFYNLRSRIVHGEFKICHPFYNERLDEKMEEYIENLQEPLDFATGLIISIIQKMVKNKWSKIEFEEKLLAS